MPQSLYYKRQDCDEARRSHDVRGRARDVQCTLRSATAAARWPPRGTRKASMVPGDEASSVTGGHGPHATRCHRNSPNGDKTGTRLRLASDSSTQASSVWQGEVGKIVCGLLWIKRLVRLTPRIGQSQIGSTCPGFCSST
jgi:hypothetical protein